MNTALLSIDATATMSSLLIAEITGKRHDHVVRDIETMFDALEGVSPDPGTPKKEEEEYHRGDRTQYKYLKPSAIEYGITGHWNKKEPLRTRYESSYVNEQNKQTYRCYQLPKRECLILISGYDVVLRSAIIDRWQELEAAQSFSVPKTMGEALRLAADLQDALQIQTAQLAIAAPKVEFYDTCMESDSVCQMAIAAQVAKLPFGRNTLFQKLREIGAFITGGERHNMPYQELVNRGLFTVNQRTIENPKTGAPIVIHTSYATQKGIAWIIKQFGGNAQPERSEA